MSSTTTAILDKLRRAYRNNSGTHFTHDELKALAKLGAVHLLAKAEADEILADLDPQASVPKDQPMPRVFSVRTLAEWWQCSEGTVRNMIAKGELRSFRHGNLIRIPTDAVAEAEATLTKKI